MFLVVFVCLLTRIRKNYLHNIHGSWWKGVAGTKEGPTKFWDESESRMEQLINFLFNVLLVCLFICFFTLIYRLLFPLQLLYLFILLLIYLFIVYRIFVSLLVCLFYSLMYLLTRLFIYLSFIVLSCQYFRQSAKVCSIFKCLSQYLRNQFKCEVFKYVSSIYCKQHIDVHLKWE